MIRRSAGLRTGLVLLAAWFVASGTGPVQAAGAGEAGELLRISEVQGSGATVAIAGSVVVDAIGTSLFEDDDLLSPAEGAQIRHSLHFNEPSVHHRGLADGFPSR